MPGSHPPRRQGLKPGLVALVGLLLSAAAAWQVGSAVNAAEQRDFLDRARAVTAIVERRCGKWEDVLHGVHGLWASSEDVTRAEFRRYTDHLRLRERYPGFLALQFVRYVRRADKARFEAQVRADTSLQPAGYPGFAVHPAGERDDYYVADYIEPMAGNEAAFGFDAAITEERRATLEQARDSGRLTGSGRLSLVQAPHGAGYVLREPVYRGDMPIQTVEQRRAAFVGMATIVLQIDQFVAAALPDELLSDIGFALHDLGWADAAPALPGPATLLHDTAQRAGGRARAAWARHASADLRIAGRLWRLEFSGRRSAAAAASGLATLAGGLAITALLALLLRGRENLAARVAARTEELARANAALGAGEQRLELALAGADLGLWDWDLRSGRVTWNARWLEMRGHAAGTLEPSTATWEQQIHPEDRAATRAALDAHLAGERAAYETRYRTRHADGRWIWVLDRGKVVERDADGRPLRVAGTNLDVTESERAGAALRDSEARMSTAERIAGAGSWSVDASGRFAVSQGLLALFGLPAAAQPDYEALIACVDERDRARVDREWRGFMASPRTRFDTEFAVAAAGARRVIAAIGHAERDASGGARRVVGSVHDVTAAREVERLRREREAAEQASRAKSELIARISHELRTPLNAILGFAQLMRIDEGDAATRRERIDRIHGAGAHLLEMINEMLDLSQLEAGRIEIAPADLALAPLVAGCVGALEPQAAAAGVRIEPLRADAALAVRADATRLRAIVLNLLSNAVKYNRRGGSVRLHAHAVGSQVRLAVEDDGIGLDAAQLANLFQPFNRLGAERLRVEGSGLGLAIAKRLAQLMDGELSATSRAGVGSVFTLALPAAAAADVVAPPAGAAPAPAPPWQPLDVVYIEDEPVNALLVQQVLELRGGCRVRVAEDGASGIAEVLREPPQLVLIDLNLPDMSGYEVLERLRAEPASARLRCVALSADARPQSLERARAAGFDAAWTKPIDVPGFLLGIEGLAIGIAEPAG